VVYDYATQTAEFELLPDDVPCLWQKDGIDAETRVEEDQLFHFDIELMRIVGMIVANIQKQSSLEVCDEEETGAIVRNKEPIATNGRPSWRSSKKRGQTQNLEVKNRQKIVNSQQLLRCKICVRG
jgi:hypothetical protein